MNRIQKVRWGLLGCGDVTEIKSGPGFYKTEDSSVMICMRRDAARAKDYAQRHGIPNFTNDASELINHPEVDAVYIATPPSTHKEYTLQAAASGKAVYVEKPPAVNALEFKDMKEACKRADVPLFVAYYRRRLPVFMKVKELISQGVIGKVRSMNLILHQAMPRIPEGEAIPWRFLPEISGGGLLMDLGSHQLDILDWILGPVQSWEGQAFNTSGLYDVEDAVLASLVFESGVYGTAQWNFTPDQKMNQDRIEIFGDGGSLEFAAFAHQNLQVKTKGSIQNMTLPNPEHVQQPLIQSIVQELKGQGQCPSTGESALRTSLILDSLLSKRKDRG